jgi:Ca-activated chloride channel family protein
MSVMNATPARKLRALGRAGWLLWVALLALPLSACQPEKAKYQVEAGGSRSEAKASQAPADRANGERKQAPPQNKEKHESQKQQEAYNHIVDNPFRAVAAAPLSTFSIDVDTASYTNVRRFLNNKQLPPPDAVRIEEFVNYFKYDYPQPSGEHPFAVHTEVSQCPWAPKHQLVRIALQGKRLGAEQTPPRNLVFLVDTSGSMHETNRLPLLKKGLRMLVDQLNRRDRVSIIVYAGEAGVDLPPTPGDQKEVILAAIDKLEAAGSTNGGAGINKAYEVAQQAFIKDGVNRVILGTDGDWNVGVTSEAALIRLIEEKRKTGVYLSVLGFGMGNYKDATVKKLAMHGNGQAAYIDSLAEAKKVFVDDIGTLVPIAKDVKVQVEFNPARVAAYRLIGYESRLLRDEDFNDDAKDAGDMGAGHCVTALYQVVPVGETVDVPGVDPLRYQAKPRPTDNADSDELLTVKIRYIPPAGSKSVLVSAPVLRSERTFAEATADHRFAASVAAFGMLLRDSKYRGGATYAQVRRDAEAAVGPDLRGYRAEFVRLVGVAENLAARRD